MSAPLRTAIDLQWHEEGRGRWTTPAGTQVFPAEDLKSAVPDPLERARFQALIKRERNVGGQPLLVHLDGAVRCIDRAHLRGAEPATPWTPAPMRITKGGRRPTGERENGPAATGYADCPDVQRSEGR